MVAILNSKRPHHPSVCIIIPYFGRWPFWMDFFVESCRWNPGVSWLLYTDCDPLPDCPDNVCQIPISFEDYNDLVSAELEIPFKPASPYKLCDLKPALGWVHRRELVNYNFWGFGDIDVIYGQLLPYYEPLLHTYECVSSHARRISGHLCLLKNNERMSNTFRHVKGWQQILGDPEHHAFDEKEFSRLFIRHKNFPSTLRRFLLSFGEYSSRARLEEDHTTPNCRIAWHDGSHDYPVRWYWCKGRLTNANDGDREFPYLHFMYWKDWGWPKGDTEALLPANRDNLGSKRWIVSNRGFSF